MEILVPITIFICIVYTFRLYWDHQFRKLLVEKGLGKELQDILKQKPLPVKDNVPSALKWGMVLIAVGAGGFLGLMMPHLRDEYTLAFMILFAGIALVIYYFIAARQNKKQA